MSVFVWAVLGYLCGSVPFGLILTKLAGLGDIRTIGSGNIGATNVLRTGNKKIAFATLMLDGFKAAFIIMLAHHYASFNIALVTAFFALLGHIFPVWLKFKGGKGVATSLGAFLALAPQVGLMACAVWLFCAAITRYSSVSALVATALTPFIAWGFGFSANLPALCAFIATLVWFTHRDNIKRLLNGTEPKIGTKIT